MTNRIVITAAVALGLFSTLAFMNHACKNSGHAWCAPLSNLPHHIRTAIR